MWDINHMLEPSKHLVYTTSSRIMHLDLLSLKIKYAPSGQQGNHMHLVFNHYQHHLSKLTFKGQNFENKLICEVGEIITKSKQTNKNITM